MKEATGDLNMTVVIVIIVAGLVAFFSMVVAPLVVGGIKSETNCSDAICDCSPGQVKCSCHLPRKTKTFTCPNKG